MEYIILFAVLFLIFVIYVIRSVIEDKKRRLLFEKALRQEYGKRAEKRYPDGRLDNLKKRFAEKSVVKGFVLDDITCNDLEFETLFKRIDRCFSSAGEECLYSMLRTPVFDDKELERRRKLKDHLEENEDERVALQMFFACVGRTGKYSAGEYLDNIMELEEKSSLPHYVLIAVMLISVAVMFFNTGAGVFILLTALIYNFITYFKEKSRIDPYITTFAYFLRLLDVAKELQKMYPEAVKNAGPAGASAVADGNSGDVETDNGRSIINDTIRRISDDRKPFESFYRFSFFLTGSDGMSSGPLDIVMDYLRMGLHLNLIKFNSMQKTVKKYGQNLEDIIYLMGYIEALISVGEFEKSLKTSCCGILTGTSADGIYAKAMYHPLIDEAVANDLELNGSMLLTGSNASGKSTFLKTVAVCQLLAQTITVVPASEFRSGFYRIYSSMSLRDDLEGGRSYFVVEIDAIKRILDAVTADNPEDQSSKTKVMCFVDEVLRGTNTIERIAASAQILESFDEMGIQVFAATHDNELTYILEDSFDNYHFEEKIENNDVLFNYRLQKGRAKSRNAIRLLSVMGYSESITGKALARAEMFEKTGEWIAAGLTEKEEI